MRLINVHSRKLHEFYDADVPPYAILSHTWGDDEVTYEELTRGQGSEKEAYRKIRFLCLQAIEDALEWAWLDTCCINKDSSAELSEAINSMFRWYHRAECCYAFLSDLPADMFWEDERRTRNGQYDIFRELSKSRWFRRGWCLQELIAPRKEKFYGRMWNFIGDRDALSSLIARITGIREVVLRNPQVEVRRCSVAEKMSWAASRETSRVEDTAYCLLGIFYVNMPMLYGEGKRAFQRLQEEIIRATDDQSIFVWQPRDANDRHLLLAPEPSCFTHGALVVTVPALHHVDGHSLGNTGLRISLPLGSVHNQPGSYHALLGCRYRDDYQNVIALCLQSRTGTGENKQDDKLPSALYISPTIARSGRCVKVKAPHTIDDSSLWPTFIITRTLPAAEKDDVSAGAKYWFDVGDSNRFSVVAAYPPRHFNSQTLVMDLSSSHIQYGAVLVSMAEDMLGATRFDKGWQSKSLAIVFGGWTTPGTKYDPEKHSLGIFGIVQSSAKNLENACRLAVSRSIMRGADASQSHVAWVRSTYTVLWGKEHKLNVSFKGDRKIGILSEVVNIISVTLHDRHENIKSAPIMTLLKQSEEADSNLLSVERLQDVVRSWSEGEMDDRKIGNEGPRADMIYELEDDSWRGQPPEEPEDSEDEAMMGEASRMESFATDFQQPEPTENF